MEVLFSALADKSWKSMLVRPITVFLVLKWLLFGFVTVGMFWPPMVRAWLWDSNISKDEDSMKNSIQDIKRKLTFERKESTVEGKLNSMISEIKNDIESKNKQMMEKINILTSKHDKISEDMNI